ncbi:hypothetical protein KY290_021063 [Solanum tuberosum]|uniref:Uncharacterized protein n=1 Tax=Solanum tuberosum TaxID=4113 RepID=A0ABQ7V3I7_SOLTU|nr:hypothetical protein KY289_020246 [Solanum tuberosum]KAH0692911.1 hypothetical protein KY285_020008 [Solanum tuberosum]KAH0757570.1 hypothetical protein KY290_021063 [Solanum tuberosum]
MLVSKGLRSPSFLKTGTTIVSLIFKVLTLEFLQWGYSSRGLWVSHIPDYHPDQAVS